MKLSEAIREGAKLGPQGFGALREAGRFCAMGAAMEAVGVTECHGSEHIYETFPLTGTKCPCGDNTLHYLGGSLALDHLLELNDREHWTREQIADFVAALELADEATEKALREQSAELVSA